MSEGDAEEVWWELYDENHNRHYYYNTVTEQTVWERPLTGEIITPVIEEEDSYEELVEEEPSSEPEYPLDSDEENTDFSCSGAVFEQGSEDSLAPTPPAAGGSVFNTASVAPLPPPIAEDLPISSPALAPSVVARFQDAQISRQSCPPPREYPLTDGWEEFYDKGSNSFYYLHKSTGQRTWDRDVACGLLPMVDISEGDSSETDTAPSDMPREYPKLESTPAPSPAPIHSDRPQLKVGKTEPQLSAPPTCKLERERGGSMASVMKPTESCSSDKINRKNKDKGKKSRTSMKKGKKNRAGGPGGTPVSRQPTLPSDLQDDINMFQLEGYAKEFFETHKRGIFRRQVPVKEMLCWTKETIPTSLTRLSPELAKEAVKNFKAIQMYSGDRASKNEDIPLALDIIGRGINRAELRDEIYCQLGKQTCFNPSSESNHKVWQLMVLSSLYFPPSRDLEKWLKKYISEYLKDQSDPDLPVYAKYVLKKIDTITETGARGRLPAVREIERFRDAPFSHTVFGVTLDEIMEKQAEQGSQLLVPQIVVTLSEEIRRLGGMKAEGIFRVPGDTEQVYSLRIQLDKGNYEVNVDDPNTPASLLKLWLRELEEPLVPVDFYDECINTCKDDENNTAGAFEVLERLPQVNRLTALFVVHFLKQVSLHEEVNKMSVANLAMVFAPNYLRCPSEDPQVILNNTKYEQAWLRSLMAGIDLDVPPKIE